MIYICIYMHAEMHQFQIAIQVKALYNGRIQETTVYFCEAFFTRIINKFSQ